MRHALGNRSVVNEYPIASGQTIAPGDLLTLNGSNEITKLIAANPQAILGVALSGTDAFYPFPTVGMVDIATGTTFYAMTGLTAPVAADKGKSFGISLNDGAYAVNKSETTTVSVRVMDIIPERNLYVVQFVEAARQVKL
jgi:hypothetical protein